MGMQIQYSPLFRLSLSPFPSPSTSQSLLLNHKKNKNHKKLLFLSSNYSSANNNHDLGLKCKYEPLLTAYNGSASVVVAAASSGNVLWSPESDKPTPTPSPSLSDILWPSLGAFAAMAMLGKVDQMLAPKGMSMTIAPLGAVCAVLFITPNAPAARKYNMFMAQIGCAAIGVLAFTLLGPGWLARSAALAASLAFMIYTKSTHPPAASLPLLFIDGAKFHSLNYWYAFFPGAAGCILLSLVDYYKSWISLI